MRHGQDFQESICLSAILTSWVSDFFCDQAWPTCFLKANQHGLVQLGLLVIILDVFRIGPNLVSMMFGCCGYWSFHRITTVAYRWYFHQSAAALWWMLHWHQRCNSFLTRPGCKVEAEPLNDPRHLTVCNHIKHFTNGVVIVTVIDLDRNKTDIFYPYFHWCRSILYTVYLYLLFLYR